MPSALTIGPSDARLEYVGPSMWGYVYREVSGSRYYRILPIEDVVALSKRLEIDVRKDWGSSKGLAPIVETGDVTVQGNLFFYAAYKTDGRNLSHLLSDADPQSRLFLLSKVMSALPTWWESNGAMNCLMPTDIVFNQQWPMLLALPSLGLWPRFETLIAEPSRIPFLAPELVRGNRQLIRDRNIDLYGCGVMMLQCIFSWEREG